MKIKKLSESQKNRILSFLKVLWKIIYHVLYAILFVALTIVLVVLTSKTPKRRRSKNGTRMQI
ncbi:hypothetical protein CSW08_05670 [Confluentibacter flavum]|uniref:Uncharacterized protein n=1 Tax=Confluentibacter flavum TaxID=1909700 RepID=A0A2N3HLR4_9FLAO|nr:hypothetical protein CSW08_05670 [Confluentibacter flavum]